MSDPMSDEPKRTPIADSFKRVDIPDDRPEGGTLAVEGKGDDIGVSVEWNKDIGKPGGAFVGAEASWWRKQGRAFKAWIGWK